MSQWGGRKSAAADRRDSAGKHLLISHPITSLKQAEMRFQMGQGEGRRQSHGLTD